MLNLVNPVKWFISDISLLSAQFLLLGTRYFYRSIFFQSFPFYWPYTIISFLLLYFLSYCYFDFTFSLLLFHFCLYCFCCLFFIFIFFSTYYKPHFNLWSDLYCVCGMRVKFPKEDYKIRKSVASWILDPEKTYSSSFPFIHSVFIMYLHLEAINKLLKMWLLRAQTANEPWLKMQPPDQKQLKNWTKMTISNFNFLIINSLFLHPTISYSWS